MGAGLTSEKMTEEYLTKKCVELNMGFLRVEDISLIGGHPKLEDV